jgi:hypothetical protein
MSHSFRDVHEDVQPSTYRRLPTPSSAVCRCGAVYDHGNIAVPTEYLGMCGRCAFDRRRRLGGRSPGPGAP